MARGWESKSIEQQQEEATSTHSSTQSRAKPLTPEQASEQNKRRGLELSRKRILQQLALASSPQHRAMLEAALAELDAKLEDSKP